MMIQYQILVPAYNAETTISTLLDELSLITPKPQKITVVDDGSEDDTLKICQSYEVEILRNPVNQGKGSALKKGFEVFLDNPQADYLLCMDADLQHPVSSIPEFLITATETKSWFIIGSRERSIKSMPFHRILSNSTTSHLLSLLTRQKVEDSQCGFRLLHRDVLKQLTLNEKGYQLETEMLLKASEAGIRMTFLTIPTIYASEKSHMRHLRDTFLFIRLVLKHIFKKK